MCHKLKKTGITKKKILLEGESLNNIVLAKLHILFDF